MVSFMIYCAASRENLPSVSTRSDINQAVQLQKMARGFYEVKGLFYQCCGNKGADQLWDNTADLRLCICIFKSRFSHDMTRIY